MYPATAKDDILIFNFSPESIYFTTIRYTTVNLKFLAILFKRRGNMNKSSKHNMESLQSEEQTHILDAIDEMRDLGVNEDISIPQVCLPLYSIS